ncbi:MAG TPA: glucokinase [Acidobacteriota bacterium]|nr:glucokinase [Acidobacteriota bacterium]
MKAMLAGYISGSSVDLARVRNTGNRVELYDQANFVSTGYSDLESILKIYHKKSKGDIDVACFGVAGPVIRNEVSTTNLPWHIVGGEIEKRFSIKQVRLLNDIVATAYGLPHLGPDRFYTINEGNPGENGNLGLIAAGAGLGEALIYRTGDQIHPYASEGGHADFAPSNQIQAELWEYLYGELGNVEVEDIVSLTGLERIFNFLVDTHGGVRGEWYDRAENRAAAIIEMALSGRDRTAGQALDIFIDCYASEAANLALKGMTLGGIYIGGQIAPQIITALDQGRFMEHFVKHGKMESLLAGMPVGVIIEEKTALLGAAGVSTAM